MDHQDTTKQAAPASGRMKAGYKRVIAYIKAGYNDDDLLLKSLAVKGGALAVSGAAVVATSLVTLPFALGALGVVAITGLAAVGVYGIVSGAQGVGHALRNIKHKVRFELGQEKNEHPDAETLPEKITLAQSAKSTADKIRHSRLVDFAAKRPFIQKIIASKTFQTFKSSAPVRWTRRALKEQEIILNSLAVGGSGASIVLGGLVLATQAVSASLIFASSAVLFTVVSAIAAVSFAVYALHWSGKKLVESIKDLKNRTLGKKKHPEKKTLGKLFKRGFGLSDSQAKLLPPDGWIVKNIYESVKTAPGLKETLALTVGGMTVLAGGVVGALAMPVIGGFAGAAVITAFFAGGGIALLGGASVLCGVVAFDKVQVPAIKENILKRYFEYQKDRLISNWKDSITKSETVKKREAAAPEPAAPKPTKTLFQKSLGSIFKLGASLGGAQPDEKQTEKQTPGVKTDAPPPVPKID